MAVVYLAEEPPATSNGRPQGATPGTRRNGRVGPVPARDPPIIGKTRTRTWCHCSTRAKPREYRCSVMPYIEGGDAAGQVAAREAAGDRGRTGDHPGKLPGCAVLRTRVEVSSIATSEPREHHAARGHALLADLGFGGPSERWWRDDLTGTGVAIGTVAYMSPGQALGGANVDERSDPCGLACVL